MTEAVIVAIVTGLFAFLGNAVLSHNGRIKDAEERARLDERTAQRLASIEKKLDEHNHYSEKLGGIAQDLAAIRAEVEFLKERK